VTVLTDHDEGINISRWWNLGLDWIAEHADPGPYEVLCAESDVRITGPTLDRLRAALRGHGLAVVGADWYGVTPGAVEIQHDLTPGPLTHRLPGVCLLVAGELQLRYDPQFRWWYADDDFEWQHRKAGGSGLVGGTSIDHGPGRPLADERATYALVDYPRFIAKWGAPNIR
jgi:hypothetical protein